MTNLSRRQLLRSSAVLGLGGVAALPGIASAAQRERPTEFFAFQHLATTDIAPGTVVGFGPDGMLAPAGQVTIDSWFYKFRGVRAPGRAVRSKGGLLLPVAVTGVVDVLVMTSPGTTIALGDILGTTTERGVAGRGAYYHRIGVAISTLDGGQRALVRAILAIDVI
jgi:hypothetical protein